MADERLDQRTALVTPASGDLVHLVDVSDTTDNANGTSKKITFANLTASLATLTGAETLTNKTLTSPKVTAYDGLFVGANKVLELGTFGTPANYVLVETAEAGNGAVVASAGSDTNVNLALIAKGSGVVTASGVEVVNLTKTQTLTNKTLTYADNTLTGVVGTTATQTLTNKTINADNNTVSNIGTTAIKDANVTNRKMKLDEIQHVTSTTDMNTASTSYVDYTGLSVTFTPNVASNFLILFSCVYYLSSTAVSSQSFIVDLDGSTSGNDPFCSGSWSNASTGNVNIGASGWMWITGVTAASHTLKIKLKTSGGTVRTRYGQLTVIPFAS